jgi:hypothetical protein
VVTLSFSALLVAAGLALMKWRYGLALCVLVGLVQDPVRKLVAGQPVYYVIFVGVVFGAAVVGAWISRVKLHPKMVHGWHRHLQTPAMLFVGLLIGQALHSMMRWGNPMLPALGAVFYIAPVLAVMFAHQYAVYTGTAGIRRFMWVYVGFSIVWFVGLIMEKNGISSRALGEVGVGQIIYSFGLNKKAASGFYRAAEVAAWHVAMVSCFLFMLMNGKRLSLLNTLIVGAVVCFLLYVGFITGRRKMIVYVVVFVCTYIGLFALFLKGKARMAVLVIIAGAIGTAVLLGALPEFGEIRETSEDWGLADRDQQAAWVARGLSVFAAIPERFALLGYAPVQWAVDGYGWMGAGLGTGAQGAQHFGGGSTRFGGAAEGGLGKLTMDLGVPGVVVFVWLVVSVAQMVWRRLGALSYATRPYSMLGFGLAGVLVANVSTFLVATQVFGDVFVLLIIGWTLGFMLALPAVAAREMGVLTQVAVGSAAGYAAPGTLPAHAASQTSPVVARDRVASA